MAWARISDDFLDHPKVADLTVDVEGLAALGLWTSALCWVRADRRRGSRVPAGIAIRLSAGAGRVLAERLVAVGLWDQVDGGYHFHDFEDVYAPADVAEARSAAGRAGGKASGRVRAARRKAEEGDGSTAKQVASDQNQTSGAERAADEADLFSEHAPSSKDDSPPTGRSKPEAKTKQLASSGEAKQVEASHARTGTTTHYPEASNEASTSPPSVESATSSETLQQRVNRVARTYTDVVKLSNFMGVRSIVKKALTSGDYTEPQVIAALEVLARERDTVTANTLRIAIEGLPKRITDRHINRPYTAPRINQEPGSRADAWNRRRANAEQQH